MTNLHTAVHSPSRIKFYNATAMKKLAANITADFAALRGDRSSLTQTDFILARIPGILMDVTAAAAAEAVAEASKTTAARPEPTKMPYT
jgi:hypothetical protein